MHLLRVQSAELNTRYTESPRLMRVSQQSVGNKKFAAETSGIAAELSHVRRQTFRGKP